MLCAAAPSLAADLSVTVKDASGAPVRNAVVSVMPASGAPAGVKLAGPFVVAQQNVQFQPYVLIVPVGAEVTFPNKDKVRHHVYSFSTPKRFELKLYGKEEARTVTFDKPGTVALGCNIHDQMSGFIKVVDTPLAVKTDAKGVAVLHGVPGGSASLRIWHPPQRTPGGESARPITVPASGASAQAVSVTLRSTEDADRT
jgi:plastocyanin